MSRALKRIYKKGTLTLGIHKQGHEVKICGLWNYDRVPPL